MTDTNPRDLIKHLIDALKEECNWIDNPKHDELIAKATAYLAQYDLEVPTDEELNSEPSPNNLQIRSFGITPPPELVEQWRNEWIYKAPGDNDELGFLALRGARWGADQELEACCNYFTRDLRESLAAELRAARRPKPPSLKEQALALIDECTDPEGDYLDDNALATIRRALEQLPDCIVVFPSQC